MLCRLNSLRKSSNYFNFACSKLEAEIRLKMSERNDYQAYYYRPTVAKYHRISKEAADELEALRGD